MIQFIPFNNMSFVFYDATKIDPTEPRWGDPNVNFGARLMLLTNGWTPDLETIEVSEVISFETTGFGSPAYQQGGILLATANDVHTSISTTVAEYQNTDTYDFGIGTARYVVLYGPTLSGVERVFMYADLGSDIDHVAFRWSGANSFIFRATVTGP